MYYAKVLSHLPNTYVSQFRKFKEEKKTRIFFCRMPPHARLCICALQTVFAFGLHKPHPAALLRTSASDEQS